MYLIVKERLKYFKSIFNLIITSIKVLLVQKRKALSQKIAKCKRDSYMGRRIPAKIFTFTFFYFVQLQKSKIRKYT